MGPSPFSAPRAARVAGPTERGVSGGAEEPAERAGLTSRVESFDASRPGPGAEAEAPVGVGEEPVEGEGELGPVAGGDENAGVTDHLGDTGQPAGDHRCPARHRFQHGPGGRVLAGGQAQQISLLEQLDELRILRSEPMQPNPRPGGDVGRCHEVEVDGLTQGGTQYVEQERTALLVEAAADEQDPRTTGRDPGSGLVATRVDTGVDDGHLRPRTGRDHARPSPL